MRTKEEPGQVLLGAEHGYQMAPGARDGRAALSLLVTLLLAFLSPLLFDLSHWLQGLLKKG